MGRTRLRRLARQLNGLADAELVTGDGETIWLASPAEALRIDVGETRRAALAILEDRAIADDDRTLLATASHAILAGCGTVSDAFDSWLDGRRQEHERLLVRALRRLADRQLQSGLPEAALARPVPASRRGRRSRT